jgi:hypothetical protein
MRIALFSVALLLTGCIVEPVPREAPPPPPPYEEAAPQPPPASVIEEPPAYEPAPVAVGWAPPPMLVEAPPPMPFVSAVWVGGYWVWRGNWVWASGHWMGPPEPSYMWVHPYYEHRGGAVIFIDGHWSPPGVVFVPPPPTLQIVLATPAVGVIPGPRPIGPEGCFVPAPPGSRRGIIVPAPMGTAPAVVTSAPPVVAVGMRVTTNVTNVNNTHITNVTNVTNINNVTIVAPAGVTASGHSFNGTVPAAPHLAAARPALVQAPAPAPVSTHPVAPYTPAAAAGGFAAHTAPHQPLPPTEPLPAHNAAHLPPPATQPLPAHNAAHQPLPTAEPLPAHAGPSTTTAHSTFTPAPQPPPPGAPHAPAVANAPPGAGSVHAPPKAASPPPAAAHTNGANTNGQPPSRPEAGKAPAKKPEHEGQGQEPR